MGTNVKGTCIDVVDFKCPAFCNLQVFNEGHTFDKSTSMVVSSNRYGITIVASLNKLCLIPMKHIHQLVGDFGIEKNTLTNFLKREIELDFCANFLDLSCDEDYIAVAGTDNSKPSITVYNVESLISQEYISSIACIKLEATFDSYVVDMSWNPGVQNSFACCLSDGSLFIIDLKNGGDYTSVNLPPQSNTLCLSWSPKGKQIIIGSSNGSLTQYKPELKAVKQYSPPTDVAANVNVNPIKVKWISNFQFAVVYDFVDDTNEQPSLYILNTPKNAPVEFVNFEQYVVMNSDQYRLNQYYTIFQQSWNLMFVASSNCTEIGVMGINGDNQWQCWMSETRPELPYRLDKQMYPIGMSLDLSSQMRIKQLSKSNEEIFLEPMPVLCVLSSNGLLFMYHIENQLSGYLNICKPSTEIPNNVFTQLFTTDSKTNCIKKDESIVTEVEEQVNVIDLVNARGDQNESILANYLETSGTSQAEQPQILFDTQHVPDVKPILPAVSTTIVTPVQSVVDHSNLPNNNEEPKKVENQVMMDELFEDVKVFQSQIENILQLSVKTSQLKVGSEKDKETLVKKWVSLDTFFKELNETNKSQWAESKALQKAVLDSISWIEDSKSRLFFFKNPRYKCLLKNESDEPFSKTLFDNIERTLYYIETQLTHVDDQLKSRYDNYIPTNKDLKIPCLETIYKSLVVNTNIVNKLKEKVNGIFDTVEEVKYRTFKKLALAPDVVQNTSKLNKSRDVGLSKLSEQLLKITLGKDGVSAINSYNIAKKYSVLSANQRALSDSKVNQLQEWLKDFKTRRTKITTSHYANLDLSKPVCSTPLKSMLKQKILEKNIDITPVVTKENFTSAMTQTPLLNKNCNPNKVIETKFPITSKAELAQFKTPLFVSPTQQKNAVISPISVSCSSESNTLHTSTNVTSVWSHMGNSSTPKPQTLNDLSNKFNYKTVSNDALVFSATNSTGVFGINKAIDGTANKNPIDFSLKPSTTMPFNFTNTLNTVSTKSTLDIVSSTTESKEKTPFNFTSVSTTKIETAVPKTNSSTFNFADAIKNKISEPNNTSLSSFKFEVPKALAKPLETPGIFSRISAEDKSKIKQETVPAKETPISFNFNSKPDTTSFSSFSFSMSKDDASKPITLPETKSLFTSTSSAAVSASFSFSLPAKTLSTVVTEPVGSPTISSTFGNVKTNNNGVSTLPFVVSSNSVTESTPQISESPTPIVSEPVTPENEKASTPTIVTNTSVFEIPSTSATVFGASISSTDTSSILDCTTNKIDQKSIFDISTNSTSAPSIFNTPINTTISSTIFNSSTNTTSTSSIFNTSISATSASNVFKMPATTNTVPSVFGTPTNATTASSMFGTQTSVTTSSIFGTPTSTTNSSIFGSSMKTTASSLFGSPSATTTTSIFGSATTNTSGFGSSSQTATVFGSPASTSSSIFGSPSVPASSNTLFGSTSTTTSIFGTPAATSTTTSMFGSPSTTTASSGLFGSVAAAANQPSSFGQPSLGFSSPGSAFGNMSLFGQQVCSPSQPATSFSPPANPFAVNKTPSNTPSLFSNQKTVFGQPTTGSTTNTGFGASNSGFGSATAAFGSPSMTGQSSNVGFGSPSMFGSMGTTFDSSKPSGFGQAPVFGGAATFGSPNSAQYTFGQNSASPESQSFGFGAAAQQPSTAFASLAAQSNSPSFGNMAQNQNTGFASPTSSGFGQTQQTSPFKPQGASFGGTSFSSWR